MLSRHETEGVRERVLGLLSALQVQAASPGPGDRMHTCAVEIAATVTLLGVQ